MVCSLAVHTNETPRAKVTAPSDKTDSATVTMSLVDRSSQAAVWYIRLDSDQIYLRS